MSIFELMSKTKSNELVFFEEASVALRAIVAIDNTVLGPALATCRIFNYPSENEAIEDALSLAYHNSYRAALLRRNFGGGSIVLYGDPKKVKNEMYFRALGIFLNKLNGKIVLAKGPGISHTDVLDIRRESSYIVGLQEKGFDIAKSSLVATAKGMMWGLRGIVKELYEKSSLEGMSIAIQGIGEVGSQLVELLLEEKAKITVTDSVYDKIKVIQDRVPNITVVKPDEIYKTKCDIFCSCAYNGLINSKNAEQLNCKIVTGATNVVFENDDLRKAVESKGIYYLPGFVINGGELIQFSNDYIEADYKKTEEDLKDIYHVTLQIMRQASITKTKATEVAISMAHDYIKNVAAIKMLK